MKFTINDEKILPYTDEFIYNIVANVEDYASFISWVQEVKVAKEETINNILTKQYEVYVGFSIFKEVFITLDKFYPYKKIEISLLEGPFNFLNTTWDFEKIDDNSTKVSFVTEFEFKNSLKYKLLAGAFSSVFETAQRKILNSFIKRAEELSKK